MKLGFLNFEVVASNDLAVNSVKKYFGFFKNNVRAWVVAKSLLATIFSNDLALVYPIAKSLLSEMVLL